MYLTVYESTSLCVSLPGVAWSTYLTVYESIKGFHQRRQGVERLSAPWHTVSAAEAGALVREGGGQCRLCCAAEAITGGVNYIVFNARRAVLQNCVHWCVNEEGSAAERALHRCIYHIMQGGQCCWRRCTGVMQKGQLQNESFGALVKTPFNHLVQGGQSRRAAEVGALV